MARWRPGPKGSSSCSVPIRQSSALAPLRSCVPANMPNRPVELDFHLGTLSNWIHQDDIDHGRRTGVPTSESAELRAAKRRIHELEPKLSLVRQSVKFLDQQRPLPKGLLNPPGVSGECFAGVSPLVRGARSERSHHRRKPPISECCDESTSGVVILVAARQPTMRREWASNTNAT